MTNPTHVSPFMVTEQLMSPLTCEEIIDTFHPEVPMTHDDGSVSSTTISNASLNELVVPYVKALMPLLDEKYGVDIKAIHSISLDWIPQGAVKEPVCESSEFISGNWVKHQLIDFTSIIFLTSFNDNPPFDDEFECNGGCLEFINHKFNVKPSRGDCITYPSDPRFANANSKVLNGDCFQLRVNYAATTPYVYNPKEFPGNYLTWF